MSATRVLIPSGALGLDFDPEALERGLAMGPDIIAIDGGSTDSGPAYLGRGTSKYARAAILGEWRALMAARARAGVPLVIGTAGTCGTDASVGWMLDITREIAAETGARLRVATLCCCQPPARVAEALEAGRIAPLEGAPEITASDIHACSNIVALAGAEQVGAALATGADIVICGRTTDTAIIAALPLARGADPGGAWHGAKIGECGALCTDSPKTGVLVIEFDDNGFTVIPAAKGARATPETVFAHMLYENADPFILHEPGGRLDVTSARFEALEHGRVRVTGSRWHPSPRYGVKLEGARPAGFQTVILALVRDERYVARIRDWAAEIETLCRDKARARLGLSDFTIELRLIGVDATLGALEPKQAAPLEVGVLGIITAPESDSARQIARMLNPYLLHHPLPGDSTQPTFAFPFSPPEIDRGEIFEFCLHHVMDLDDPMEAFCLEVQDIGPTA